MTNYFSRFIQLPAHSLGNIYIADLYNNRIRKVTVSTGIITTIAGSGATGIGSYSDDNGPATSATLYNPLGVAVDSSGRTHIVLLSGFLNVSLLGNVYIADHHNHRIRKVTVSTGIITTIAGSSRNGSYSGDNGPATAATLNGPSGVNVHSSGKPSVVNNFIIYSTFTRSLTR
jgi:hypothetical protein